MQVQNIGNDKTNFNGKLIYTQKYYDKGTKIFKREINILSQKIKDKPFDLYVSFTKDGRKMHVGKNPNGKSSEHIKQIDAGRQSKNEISALFDNLINANKSSGKQTAKKGNFFTKMIKGIKNFFVQIKDNISYNLFSVY